MKRLPTLFLLLFSLLTLATPGRATTITDTIRFTVMPSNEAGAENTLVYMFWEEIAYDIRMEWVSEGEREEIAWDYYMQQTITSSGQVYIYFSYEQDEMDGLRVNLRKIPVGAPEPPMFGNSNFLNVFTYSPDISAFDASGCRILDGLWCISTQLTELNISGTALTELDCSGNQLTELDISGCTALTELDCSGNQLTELDISGCTALTELDCHGNQLTDLNISGCTALKNFDCRNNQLTELDISGCTALTDLNSSNNQLTALNVDNNTALKALDCSDNQLTVLDLSHNTALRYLDSENNQLTNLNVNGCTFLIDLECGNNQLASLNVSSLQNLRFLYCQNNPFTSLDCAGNNALGILVASDCASLSQLTNVSSKQLERVAVNGCTSLMNLDCSNNKILMLNVSGCTALETLECYGNQLTSLDVSGCTALTSLECYNNQLTTLDVSANTALTDLQCFGNQLTALNVNNNTALTVLTCSNNQLSALNVSNNPYMEELQCDNNQLTTLDLSANTALTTLMCENNHISLSTLYGIATQHNLDPFRAEGQTDTITLSACQTLNLASEKTFGGTATTYTFTPSIASDAYTENDFSFQFNDPFTGTLTLQNPALANNVMGYPITMTYHITAEECSVEPPTPPTTPTDTIRFTVKPSSEAGATNTLQYGHLHDILKMEWVSGENREEIPFPGGSCTQEITAPGEVYIYYPRESQYAFLLNDDMNNTNPHYISINTNDVIVEDLNVSGCTYLKTLDCSNKQLTSLNASGCTALTSLACVYNQLISLNVSDCMSLTDFQFSEGNFQLSDLNVSGCSSLTSLYYTNHQLTKLNASGCTALTTLSCFDNQLTILDVSGCPALTTLWCYANLLTALDVSTNTALTALRCESNQLTSLDVSSCTALTQLNCYDNHLTSMNVSGCTALIDLFLQDNQLTALDVSGFTALTYLRCNNNQLTALNVNGCTALTTLWCDNNQLTDLNVNDCTALTTLWCDNNHIPLSTLYGIYTQMESGSSFLANPQTDTVTLSACQALNLASEKTLGETATTYALADEDDNEVTTGYTETDFSFQFNEPFTGTLALQNQDFTNNFFGTHDVITMTYHITAEECSVEPPTPPTTTTDTLYFEFELAEGAASDAIEYAFSDAVLPGITMEYYDGQEHPKFTPNASGSILIHGNGYGRIYYTYEESEGYKVNCTPRYNGSANNSTGDIRVQRYGNVSLTGLDAHACSAMKELECYLNQLATLNVRGCANLERLDCSQNQLTSLDVSQNLALTELYCGNNQLTALDVSQNLALTELDCGQNQLTSLDVSQNLALTELVCNNNQLTNLNVQQNPALTTLECSSNQLTVLDATQNPALTELGCVDNKLTALDISQNSDLRMLDCRDNRLTTLNVSQNSDLEQIDCSDNQLTVLDVSQNPALVGLYCDNNQLTELDVNSKTALANLYCRGNRLTELNVRGCVAMSTFYCGENQLTTLDISGCTALMMLDCQNNQLRDLDASGCESLLALSCQNNHIPLSTLYGILEPGTLMLVSAENQSDTVVIGMEQAWDLSSEKTLGETETTYVLADEAGNSVSEDAYTEDGFVFRLYEPASYTLTLQNQNLTNNFYGNPSDVITFTWHVAVREFFTVDVVSNNGAWGWATKTGSGTYEKDSMVTIIATPREGYRFVNWTKDGEEFSLNAVHTFAVTENISLVAVFEKIPEVPVPPVVDSFSVSVVSNNVEWGMAFMTGYGKYEKDSSVTIIATPNEGYRFVNWTKDGEEFSIYAVYTFAVTEDIALVANFEKIPEVPEPPVGDEFTITLIPNNPAWGMVFKTGNCVYGEGDEITILALPFAGYRFVNWTKEDGSVFGTDSLVVFKVTENLELVANFEEAPVVPEPPMPVRDTFSVQVFSNNEAWGSVSQSGDGRYEKDSLVTITATPNEGYRFVDWTNEGEVFSTDSVHTFAVTEDLELTANFEKLPDEDPVEDNFYVYVKDRTIYLSEKRGRVQVFNVIGQCYYNGRSTAIRVKTPGVYIVRVAGKNYKVLVM